MYEDLKEFEVSAPGETPPGGAVGPKDMYGDLTQWEIPAPERPPGYLEAAKYYGKAGLADFLSMAESAAHLVTRPLGIPEEEEGGFVGKAKRWLTPTPEEQQRAQQFTIPQRIVGGFAGLPGAAATYGPLAALGWLGVPAAAAIRAQQQYEAGVTEPSELAKRAAEEAFIMTMFKGLGRPPLTREMIAARQVPMAPFEQLIGRQLGHIPRAGIGAVTLGAPPVIETGEFKEGIPGAVTGALLFGLTGKGPKYPPPGPEPLPWERWLTWQRPPFRPGPGTTPNLPIPYRGGPGGGPPIDMFFNTITGRWETFSTRTAPEFSVRDIPQGLLPEDRGMMGWRGRAPGTWKFDKVRGWYQDLGMEPDLGEPYVSPPIPGWMREGRDFPPPQWPPALWRPTGGPGGEIGEGRGLTPIPGPKVPPRLIAALENDRLNEIIGEAQGQGGGVSRGFLKRVFGLKPKEADEVLKQLQGIGYLEIDPDTGTLRLTDKVPKPGDLLRYRGEIMELRDLIFRGEPGLKGVTPEGAQFSYSSSYPPYMRDKGWTKDKMIQAIDMGMAGNNFAKAPALKEMWEATKKEAIGMYVDRIRTDLKERKRMAREALERASEEDFTGPGPGIESAKSLTEVFDDEIMGFKYELEDEGFPTDFVDRAIEKVRASVESEKTPPDFDGIKKALIAEISRGEADQTLTLSPIAKRQLMLPGEKVGIPFPAQKLPGQPAPTGGPTFPPTQKELFGATPAEQGALFGGKVPPPAGAVTPPPPSAAPAGPPKVEGITFNGVQEIPKEIADQTGLPERQYVFTDDETKSTFYTSTDISPEGLASERDRIRSKFAGAKDLIVRIIDSEDPQWQDQNLGNAGWVANGVIETTHVTDDPKPVLDRLKKNQSLIGGREETKFGDLGKGLYASGVPQLWTGRARGKWEFLKRLTPEELKKLTDAIVNDPKMSEPGYLAQFEKDRLKERVQQVLDGLLSPDTLIQFSDQPYNIRFWEPEFLRELGIKPGPQPIEVPVILKGRFIELKRSIMEEEAEALRKEGYDGAFVRGGFTAYPQIVVWNNDAVLRFGEYQKAPKEWKGSAWRAETGYEHEKGAKASDVVRYEQEELGNKLGVTPQVIAELENYPATDVVWVTKTKSDAQRYVGEGEGEPTKIDLPSGSRVIAEDGEGGFLVLKGKKPELSPTEKDQYKLPGMKVGIEFGKKGKVEAPQEKLPLMEAAKKAEEGKEPTLFEPEKDVHLGQGELSISEKDVTLPNGEIIKVDTSLAPIITKLNKAGLKTTFCCSGLKEEHTPAPGGEVESGYIGFDVGAGFDRIAQIGEELGFDVERNRGPSGNLGALRMPFGIDDKTKKAMWNALADRLTGKKVSLPQKKMDLGDWMSARNKELSIAATIWPPKVRLEKLESIEKRYEKTKDKNWVVDNMYLAQLKVKALDEIDAEGRLDNISKGGDGGPPEPKIHKEPWEMTFKEFTRPEVGGYLSKFEQEIEKAARAGKPVPAQNLEFLSQKVLKELGAKGKRTADMAKDLATKLAGGAPPKEPPKPPRITAPPPEEPRPPGKFNIGDKVVYKTFKGQVAEIDNEGNVTLGAPDGNMIEVPRDKVNDILRDVPYTEHGLIRTTIVNGVPIYGAGPGSHPQDINTWMKKYGDIPPDAKVDKGWTKLSEWDEKEPYKGFINNADAAKYVDEQIRKEQTASKEKEGPAINYKDPLAFRKFVESQGFKWPPPEGESARLKAEFDAGRPGSPEKMGQVNYKDQVRYYSEAEEIKTGKDKGKVRVTLTNGKKVVVNKEDIIREPKFRMGEAPEEPLPREAVQGFADETTRTWRNGPKVSILDTMADIPERLMEGLRENLRKGIKGIYDPLNKMIYLVRDMLGSELDVIETLRHEGVGHYAMEAILGKDADTFFRRVYLKYGTKGLKDIADARGLDLNTVEGRLTAAREKIAQLAETGKDPGLLKQFYAWVREQIRKVFPDLKLSDAEIQTTLKRARDFLGSTEEKKFRFNADALKTVIQGENRRGAPLYSVAGITKEVGKAAYKEEVKPALQVIRDIFRGFVHYLAPTRGVDVRDLNAFSRLLGDRERYMARGEMDTEAALDAVTKLNRTQQIDLVDAIQTGNTSSLPLGLQAVAAVHRGVEDTLWSFANVILRHMDEPARIAYLENHVRNFWKVLPDQAAGEIQKRGFSGLWRRPLEGTRSPLFHQYWTLKEGMDKGGIPYTTNLIEMTRLNMQDTLKLVTARRLWDSLLDTGHRKFVKFDEFIEGFRPINDRIANQYFPRENPKVTIQTPQGPIRVTQYEAELRRTAMSDPDPVRRNEAATALNRIAQEGLPKEFGRGRWVVEENAARLLENYLGRDLIRENPVTRSLMHLKNVTTAFELGFSAFHASFESWEAVASALGLAMRKVWNQGMIEQGMKEALMAPAAPYTHYKLGKDIYRFFKDPNGFVTTERGRKFIQEFPEAAEAITHMFWGGGSVRMNEAYKVSSLNTFKENLASKNYIGAAMRSVPALSQWVMKPLFENYIPSLKRAFFLKEFSNEVIAKQADIVAGRITKAEIARDIWQFVENRFGEMNFDNLWWNRTMKSAFQLAIRSVTWKFGNIRSYGNAITNQALEFASAARERRLPKLAPEMAWVWGLAITTAAMASIAQYAFTGKQPENWKDLVYPQIDNQGGRISLPTYMRDLFHMVHAPVKYVTSSMAGWTSRFIDVLNNKDFYGVQVHDPNETKMLQLLDDAVHMMPLPFSVSSLKRMREEGESPFKQTLGFLGGTKAPYWIERTDAEQKAGELKAAHLPVGGRTPADFERGKILKNYSRRFQEAQLKGEDTSGIMMELHEQVRAGNLYLSDILRFRERIRYEPLVSSVDHLPFKDVMEVWKVATDSEKKKLYPVLMRKYAGLRNMEDRMLYFPKIQEIRTELQGGQ